MDKLTSNKALLDRIRLSESETFECNETAILNTYETQDENKSSIAIKILSVFGGLLATLALLGFLLLAGLYDSEAGLLVLGITFIGFAIFINATYNKVITGTFSVSTYVLGYALLLFGLKEMQVDDNIIVVIPIVIAIVSLALMQNYILVFIATFIISASFLTLIIINDLYAIIHLYIGVYTLLLAFIFFNEALLISTSKKMASLYAPMRIGVIFSLLSGLIAIGKVGLIPISQYYFWVSSLIIGGVIMYLIYTILKVSKIETLKPKLLIYSFSSLVLILIIFSPSILGAITIMLLCFMVNYKSGLVIGIVAFIYFISQYYYDLTYTLLTKSIILMTSGIIFLLFYLFITKKGFQNEKI